MNLTTFPWAMVGACVAVIGLLIGALKLAVAWGKAQKATEEQDRRLKVLEDASHDVPEEVKDKVKAHLEAAESGGRAMRKTLARVVLALRKLERRLTARESFCTAMHGEAVQPLGEEISDRIELPPS